MEEDKRIQIRLQSNASDIPIQNVVLFVPLSLKKYGLTEIVQHLLNIDKSTTFEFLIDGKLLSTSLQSFLDDKGWSSENILDIEVIRISDTPKEAKARQHEDWIASSLVFKAFDTTYLFTAEFNGRFNIWSEEKSKPISSQILGQLSPLMTFPIKDFDSSIIENDVYLLVAQGHAGSIYKCNRESFKPKSKKDKISFEHIKHLQGHEDTIATGSWDKTVKLATLQKQQADTAESKKRKDLGESEFYHTFEGHAGAVQVVHWQNKENSSILYSGSWDHSIRSWDVSTLQSVDTLVSPSSVLCLDYNDSLQYLASGHTDHHIRIWDCRSNGSNSLTLKGHKGFVNKVLWSLKSSHSLYSVSHDGILKFWDIRAGQPLYSLTVDKGGKLFTLCQYQDSLYVGGEDGSLIQYK